MTTPQMPIVSPKRYKLIPVTDLDIVYVGGIHDTITYTEQDACAEDDKTITIYIHDANANRYIERLICLKANMLSYKYRDRMLKVEDKTPLTVDEVGAPPAD